MIDGEHRYRMGSRRTKEYAAFLKKNKLCEKHGLKKRLVSIASFLARDYPFKLIYIRKLQLQNKLYKECKYQQGKGGSVEVT